MQVSSAASTPVCQISPSEEVFLAFPDDADCDETEEIIMVSDCPFSSSDSSASRALTSLQLPVTSPVGAAAESLLYAHQDQQHVPGLSRVAQPPSSVASLSSLSQRGAEILRDVSELSNDSSTSARSRISSSVLDIGNILAAIPESRRPSHLRQYTEKERHLIVAVARRFGTMFAAKLLKVPASTVSGHVVTHADSSGRLEPEIGSERGTHEGSQQIGRPPTLTASEEGLFVELLALFRSCGFILRPLFVRRLAWVFFGAKYPLFKATLPWLALFCHRHKITYKAVQSRKLPAGGIEELQLLLQRCWFDTVTVSHLLGPIKVFVSIDEFRLVVDNFGNFTLQPPQSGSTALGFHCAFSSFGCSVVPVIACDGSQATVVACQIIFVGKKQPNLKIGFKPRFPLVISATPTSFSNHQSFSVLLDVIASGHNPNIRTCVSFDVVSAHTHLECLERLVRYKLAWVPISRYCTPYCQIVDKIIQLLRRFISALIEQWLGMLALSSGLLAASSTQLILAPPQTHTSPAMAAPVSLGDANPKPPPELCRGLPAEALPTALSPDALSQIVKQGSAIDPIDNISIISFPPAQGVPTKTSQLKPLIVKWVEQACWHLCQSHQPALLHAVSSSGITLHPSSSLAQRQQCAVTLPGTSGGTQIVEPDPRLFDKSLFDCYSDGAPHLKPAWSTYNSTLPSPFPQSNRREIQPPPAAVIVALQTMNPIQMAYAVQPILATSATSNTSTEEDIQDLENCVAVCNGSAPAGSLLPVVTAGPVVGPTIHFGLLFRPSEDISTQDPLVSVSSQFMNEWKIAIETISDPDTLIRYADKLGFNLGRRKSVKSIAKALRENGYPPPPSSATSSSSFSSPSEPPLTDDDD